MKLGKVRRHTERLNIAGILHNLPLLSANHDDDDIQSILNSIYKYTNFVYFIEDILVSIVDRTFVILLYTILIDLKTFFVNFILHKKKCEVYE